MDLGANGENSVIAPAVDVSVADSSAEAEVMAANNGSVETEQSFLEDDTEESPAEPKEGTEKSESEKRGEELNDDNENVLSSQDEGATSQEEDEDDEEVIVNRGANTLTAVDSTECPKVTVVRPRILKAEDSKGEDKENVAVVTDPDGGEDEDDEQNVGEEGQEDEEEEEEEEEDEEGEEDEDEDDPMVAGALAAKANGSVNEWVDHLDEIDPCHRLRSLCKKGDIEGLTELLWV